MNEKTDHHPMGRRWRVTILRVDGTYVKVGQVKHVVQKRKTLVLYTGEHNVDRMEILYPLVAYRPPNRRGRIMTTTNSNDRCTMYTQSTIDEYSLECVLCGQPRQEHPTYATEHLREDDGDKD